MEPRQAFAETGKWMDSVDLENTVKNRFKAGQSQAMFCLSEKSPKSCAVLLLVNPPGGTNQWTSGKLQSIGPALSSDQVEHARDRPATPESGPHALHAVPEQLVALPTHRPPPEQQLLLFGSPLKDHWRHFVDHPPSTVLDNPRGSFHVADAYCILPKVPEYVHIEFLIINWWHPGKVLSRYE